MTSPIDDLAGSAAVRRPLRDVQPLRPAIQHYAWGSPSALPDLLDLPVTGEPVAEAWFGAHPAAPASVVTPAGAVGLDDLVAADPDGVLGPDVVARFGPRLPFLLKVIAPVAPLSLQVHPTSDEAARGYATEEADGIPRDDPARIYRDPHHKPELVYALSTFEALSGFRAPRRAAEILDGLEAPLAVRLSSALRAAPSAEGVHAAFTTLLGPPDDVSPEDVAAVAEACARRLAAGASPSVRADAVVKLLHASYPGDPGVVAALLLNPVTLRPGEAMYVPAGAVHTYLSGLGVEVMASSDNVVRAGLTSKHVDARELLRLVDYVAAPPIRIGPERTRSHVEVFYAPVDDFELTVVHVQAGPHQVVPGYGPRVVLCVAGEGEIATAAGSARLRRGEAVFVPSHVDDLRASGAVTLVQASTP